MRRLFQYCLLFGTCFFVLNARANSIVGLWKTHDDAGKPTGYVRIIESDGVYKGVIEKGLDPNQAEQFCTACQDERKDQPLIGMVMMKDVVANNNGFEGKEILDPFSGHTYRVKLKIKEAGKLLEVRGFVGLSIFGRTQIWRRATDGQ